MTFGEMYELTQRFNQIIGGSQFLKHNRLKQFMQDLEDAYSTDGVFDDFYAQLMQATALQAFMVI